MRPCTASSHAISSSGRRKRMVNGVPRCRPPIDLVRRQPVTATVVAEGRAGCFGRGALGIELGFGAEAAVRLALGQQSLRVGLVARSVLALEEGSFVPGDAEPGEPVEDDLGVALGASLPIGVLDAKHQRAAGVAGKEPVEQRGASAADVEIAGGRRSETDAGSGHGYGSGGVAQRNGAGGIRTLDRG